MPSGLSATANGGNLAVTWNAAADNGAPVSSYQVAWTPTSGSGGGSATQPGDARSMTITGLTRGTAYRITVTAQNSAGRGAPATAQATVPPPPRSVTVSRGRATTYEDSCHAPDCAFMRVVMKGFKANTNYTIKPHSDEWPNYNPGTTLADRRQGEPHVPGLPVRRGRTARVGHRGRCRVQSLPLEGRVNSARAAQAATLIAENVQRVIHGKPELVRLTIAGLLAEGHLLIEDVPGLGKTTLARCLARSIGGRWSRIQFTPDLLPSDITGVTVYHQRDERFTFHPGAVFANVVVADEINRGTPKTQSALLEVMSERRVTVDAEAHEVPRPFLVVATQNPIEMEGTYRLPEAQLDRFLMRLSVGYPDLDSEVQVIMGDSAGESADDLPAVVEIATLREAIAEVRALHVDRAVAEYAVRLTAATREHAAVRFGASVRGSMALVRAAQAFAAIDGRAFVTPDDIKDVAVPVLAHRLVLTPEAELNLRGTAEIVAEVLTSTSAPMASAGR